MKRRKELQGKSRKNNDSYFFYDFYFYIYIFLFIVNFSYCLNKNRDDVIKIRFRFKVKQQTPNIDGYPGESTCSYFIGGSSYVDSPFKF